jgi:hypothetical protein
MAETLVPDACHTDWGTGFVADDLCREPQDAVASQGLVARPGLQITDLSAATEFTPSASEWEIRPTPGLVAYVQRYREAIYLLPTGELWQHLGVFAIARQAITLPGIGLVTLEPPMVRG